MTVRMGLLGTGFWAREVHAPAIADTEGLELVAVWGRDPRKAADLAAGYDGAKSYADVDGLLGAVDAVAFALPPDVQAPLAAQAAAAGRHLLLEKPLALDVAQANRVVEAAEANGVASVVFFTSRYQPSVVSWLDEVTTLGGWQGGHADWLGSIYQPGSPFAESPWRRERGGLWDVGPHALSVILPVLGPVTEVHAVRGCTDSVRVVMTHRGGPTSSMVLSLDAPPAAATSTFRIYGEAGWSQLPDRSISSQDALHVAAEQLLGNIEGHQTRHPCDVRFALDVVAVLEAADRSLTSGQPEQPGGAEG